jgi:hypothetical protein
MRRLGFLVFLCLRLARFCDGAAPELLVFDEDDSLGADYYDSSIGYASKPSLLRLDATSGDKMPINSTSAAAGQDSGIIEWSSNPGGSWEMHVFAPGFPILNLTNFDRLIVALNGPDSIRAIDLPELILEDTLGQRRKLSLAQALPGGVDAKKATWQTVEIAFTNLTANPEFDFSRVKHVTFAQGASDARRHTLWIDDLRFTNPALQKQSKTPSKPHGLAARSGDRSVALHWDATPGADEYHVFRATKPAGDFKEITVRSLKMQSFADVTVENNKSYFYQVRARNRAGPSEPSDIVSIVPRIFQSNDDFLEYVQATAFDYFWCEADAHTGLIRDRSEPWSAVSIAATGFGLTGMGIGIDHGWITREQGASRVLQILKALAGAPQGPEEAGRSGYKGWFYHFLEPGTGLRFGTSELSSIDTALLLAGVLYVREFFLEDTPKEKQIRLLADRLCARVDWQWMLNDGTSLSMGWYPTGGFINARWSGYSEGSILYLLAIGSSNSSRLDFRYWNTWAHTHEWKTSFGKSFIHFPPLFGHQYTACWVDYSEIADEFTTKHGLTYFENSRRATLSNRAYCMANPKHWKGYGPNVWGLTACDGPGSRGAFAYVARGAPPPENDDGTIAPTAAGGSLPFTPTESLECLRYLYDSFRARIWCGYGFRDAFNLAQGWWDTDVIGIDQGPILLMAENLRTKKVWNVMKRSSQLPWKIFLPSAKPVANTHKDQQNQTR